MKTLKLFSILVIALGMMSCSKDDDDNSVTVEELQGLNYYYEQSGYITVEWDAFDGADTYYVLINDENLDYAYPGTQAFFDELEDGDVITVDAYSGTTLIASAEITYSADADEEDEDADEDVEVGEITGIQVMYMSYSYTLLWDSYSDAIEYYVYLNGTKISDIPYTGTSAKLDELSEGDVIEIKAYSDFDEEELIATGSYTYSEN
jgi:hypothetical protein